MFLKNGVRRGTKYLYEIECFRGLAVVLVFGFHVWGISFGDSKPSSLSPWVYVAAGNTGVTLFFVLSGFLLSIYCRPADIYVVSSCLEYGRG